MSWTKRLRQLIRVVVTGSAGGGRRIPLAIEYQPAQNDDFPPASLAPGFAPPPAPTIAFRRNAVFTAFNTAVPVSDRRGLAGRQKELARLVDAVVKQRKHAIIYGARGSGKTSLARVFGDLADEAGCVALYGSASIGADIDGLFRPFLAELPVPRGGGAAAASTAPLDVQQLANLFVQSVSQLTLLIVDEFDRVAAERTKHDVATLLKLLSDMHSPVQIVLVGIAGNVDGLIAAHPSLRRHLFAQPVMPIERDDLAALLKLCGRQAGVGFEEEAIEIIASAAIGSPYHARLFGMHAALAAEVANRDVIIAADARTGLAEGLSEWGDLTPDMRTLFERALAEAGPLRGMIALAGVLAAHAPVLTLDRLAAAGTGLFGEELGGRQAAEQAIRAIAPALYESAPGELQFEDSLSPQFLVLMANSAIGRVARSNVPARDTARARELLQGVAGL